MTGSYTPPPTDDAAVLPTGYLYGRNSVLATLTESPKRVTKVYLAQGLAHDKRIAQIRTLAKEAGLLVVECPRQKLGSLLAHEEDIEPGQADAVHQGVVACVVATPLLTVEQLLALVPVGQPCLVMMLDGVTDPRNLGALLRVADAAGAVGVIIPKHRSATLSPAVAKTACGAEATVPVAMATNLGQTLKVLSKAGFWSVAALCGEGVQPFTQVDYAMPTVLVMGNEESGIKPSLAAACDFKVTIPQFGQVASLNVSCAAAVLACHIALQQHQPKKA
jgi:23S rRNA (guanosine2251-2'-O)-methyltransferase